MHTLQTVFLLACHIYHYCVGGGKGGRGHKTQLGAPYLTYTELLEENITGRLNFHCLTPKYSANLQLLNFS